MVLRDRMNGNNDHRDEQAVIPLCSARSHIFPAHQEQEKEHPAKTDKHQHVGAVDEIVPDDAIGTSAVPDLIHNIAPRSYRILLERLERQLDSS